MIYGHTTQSDGNHFPHLSHLFMLPRLRTVDYTLYKVAILQFSFVLVVPLIPPECMNVITLLFFVLFIENNKNH